MKTEEVQANQPLDSSSLEAARLDPCIGLESDLLGSFDLN